MIAGYPTKRHITDHIAALEREKASVQTPGHLSQIEAQQAIFEAELRQMEEEGYGDDHEPGHPAAGTAAFYPPWNPGIGGLG